MVERRLTAILFADVVGYSRHIGNDETATLRALSQHRGAMSETVGSHGGRIVDMAGDSLLAEFPSVVEAVKCALELQERAGRLNRELDDDPTLQFRIGVDLGDVVVDGENLYGNGVNIAARLQALAPPGGISISAQVRDAVDGRIDLRTVSLGRRRVKNIRRPVHVFQVITEQSGEPSLARRFRRQGEWVAVTVVLAIVFAAGVNWFPAVFDQPKPTEVASVSGPLLAVLPFANLSDDPQQEYFSDGITADLITDLSRVSGIKVIAADSSFPYKGGQADVVDIGRQLGVGYLLTGTVRRAGDKVRINARLLDAGTGGHLWAQRYDRGLEDIFAVQADVARHISAALEVAFSEAQQARIASRYTDELAAYDLYLRGLSALTRFSQASYLQARDYYRQAIEADPEFARAMAALAAVYVYLFNSGWADDGERALEDARQYATRAVALDDTLPAAYWALGFSHLYRREFNVAEAQTRRAIALDPSYADGYALLAFIKNFTGEPENAVSLMVRAQRLNPHYTTQYLYVVGQAHLLMGNNREAGEAFRRGIERNHGFVYNHLGLAAALASMGETEEAEWAASEVLMVQPEFSVNHWADAQPYKYPKDLERVVSPLKQLGFP